MAHFFGSQRLCPAQEKYRARVADPVRAAVLEQLEETHVDWLLGQFQVDAQTGAEIATLQAATGLCFEGRPEGR